MHLIFLLLTGLLQLPFTWIEYTSPDMDFAILFPVEVQEKEKILATTTGDILINTAYAISELDSTENFLYLVNSHNLHSGLYSMDSLQSNYDFLQLTVDDISKGLNGEIMYSNQCFQDSFPAIEYRLSYQEGQLQLKGRIFINQERLYSLQVFTSKAYTLNKNMDYFLSSFKFTN